MHSGLLVAGLLLAAAGSGHGFCFHAYGGVGEYSAECDSSIEMEACYARCNCWTDFPDMGGQVTRGGSNGQVVSVSVRWLVSVSGGQVVL